MINTSDVEKLTLLNLLTLVVVENAFESTCNLSIEYMLLQISSLIFLMITIFMACLNLAITIEILLLLIDFRSAQDFTRGIS